MGFKIGCKVSVIDENITGTILKLNNFKAIVKDEDGFEIEYVLSKLVLVSTIEEYENSFNQIPIQKEILKETISSKPNLNKKIKEIDLHMHKLSESQNNMTNHEIVMYQLEAVNKALRETDKRFFSKIVFIHGIGKGKLRNELKFLLKQKNIYFQDASFNKYGSGAIEVKL